MKTQWWRMDYAMYWQAVPLLLRNPTILALPLLAGLVQVLMGYLEQLFTDPLGGMGGIVFQTIVYLAYGIAFGIATIQASHLWRARAGGFDAAVDEGRAKLGGIALATIGFYFLTYVAGYIFGAAGQAIGLLAQLVANFFLVYTIPAAAIGGLQGSDAISGSIRASRTAIFPTIVLTIVYFVVKVLLPIRIVMIIAAPFALLPPLAFDVMFAIVQAIAIAYLAFPFAKQYDEIAFRARW